MKEDSFKFQLLFSGLFIVAGFYFNISTYEWFAQLISITLVLSIEGLNTAIELIANYIQPKFDEAIGKVKDISAGAVLISGIFAMVILMIIYIPYLLALI